MSKAKAYAAASATAPLASSTIIRREPTQDDVEIEIRRRREELGSYLR